MTTMNITKFLASTTSPPLSTTATSNTKPHMTQHHHLARQVLSLRRKLGITKPPRKNKPSKGQTSAQTSATETEKPSRQQRPLPTAAEIGADHAYLRLYLLLAARAHTHALAMKEGHTSRASDSVLPGRARKQVTSRMRKAASYAASLASLLSSNQRETKATDTDILEATAYARRLSGAEELEKHVGKKYSSAERQTKAWKKCLTCFSEAQLIYSALLSRSKKETFRELLNSEIEPSLRYAAYQSGISRSVPLATIARRNFRKDQSSLSSLITSIDSNAFTEAAAKTSNTTSDPASTTSATDIPTSITWRGHTAPLSDSQIGQSLSTANTAAATLKVSYRDHLASNPHASKLNESLAALYDPVLTSSTDTLDAVTKALADLTREGVGESDKRVQDLRIASLYANYQLVSWRIGRNRVLISPALDDGLDFHTFSPKPRPSPSTTTTTDADAPPTPTHPKPKPPKPAETTTHALHRLRTRHALLASILQSLDILPALPGSARDPHFLASIERKRAYFRGLKCLNIAYSHQLLLSEGKVGEGGVGRKRREVLALVAWGLGVVGGAAPDGGVDAGEEGDEEEKAHPRTSHVSPSSFKALHAQLTALETRYRALIHMHDLLSPFPSTNSPSSTTNRAEPLINHLTHFPSPETLDLTNLVPWPPTQLEPVPVKPVFLDVAWNYIGYPGRVGGGGDGGKSGKGGIVGGNVGGEEEVGGEGEREGGKRKRGWFGFGR
ncbi:MAG: hypothetical protein M1828_003199 [Chrysothrix sp. TS-e1954]|nr:MAG: hypothetical protein M1828_003199 [Chrysothrix sp. TS-e1954]